MTAFSRNPLDVPPVDSPTPPSTETHRRNPLQVIWLRRWIVVVVMILAMGVGVVQFQRATPMYRSTARVYVTQNGPKIVGTDMGTVMSATNNYLWTQCELICSPSILEAVAQRPEISTLPTFQQNDDGRAAANVVGYLRMNVSAIPGRRDDIISIFVKSPHPKDAADIANAIVEQYRDFLLNANKSTATETRDLLLKVKKETDDQLQEMYKKRQAFQQSHSQYSLGQDRTNAIIERLNQLSSARTQAQLEVLRADAAFNSTKVMMADPEKIRQLMNGPNF